MVRRDLRYKKARAQFIKENPPDHAGYHICGYGGGWFQSIEVDHKDGRNGDLIDDLSNFIKSCHFHNTLKGSKRYQQFMDFLTENPQYKRCK